MHDGALAAPACHSSVFTQIEPSGAGETFLITTWLSLASQKVAGFQSGRL